MLDDFKLSEFGFSTARKQQKGKKRVKLKHHILQHKDQNTHLSDVVNKPDMGLHRKLFQT